MRVEAGSRASRAWEAKSSRVGGGVKAQGGSREELDVITFCSTDIGKKWKKKKKDQGQAHKTSLKLPFHVNCFNRQKKCLKIVKSTLISS